MSETTNRIKPVIIACALACVAGIGGFAIGQSNGREAQLQVQNQEKQQLQELNRSSIANLELEDGPIYVIGHRSPDSDTVCTAIAYARLLNELGFDAQPAVTMEINHESEYILKEAGVETPQVLEDASGKNIFLVDHSDYAQAAEGMQDAHIVGVLDHHGIGNIATGNVVVYDARPIGATATIVWLDYLNYGIEINKQTAQVMLGAILSDTNNLQSTYTTEADKKAVEQLAKIAEVSDVDALFAKLHEESLSYEGMTDEEIFFLDYKEYEASGVTFGIGLVNAIDDEKAAALAARMQEVLPKCFESKNVDLMYASVGIRENGEKIDYLVPANDRSKDALVGAFPNYDEFNGVAYIYRTGLGRKTKLVPGLTDYLSMYPHE